MIINGLKNISKYIAFVIFGTLFFILIMFGLSNSVYAAEIDSSSVINDLSIDPNFHQNDYPNDSDDYSLQVIQIAESTNNELYIYCYQPAHYIKDLQAVKISISKGYSSNGKNLEPHLYDLELVSTYSVFDKYKVLDFEIDSTSDCRYYNLVGIYRNYNDTIDDLVDDTENQLMSYSIGQQWCAYYLNDTLNYEMNTFKTFEYTPVCIDTVRISNGLTWGSYYGQTEVFDVHFLVFNADDYIIKHIYDADVSADLSTYEYDNNLLSPGRVYDDPVTEIFHLTDDDVMTVEGEGLFARELSWKRIQTVDDFIKFCEEDGVEFEDDVLTNIKLGSWVFTYLETKYIYGVDGIAITESGIDVSNVGILRIHFQDITGKIYDLGAVGDLLTPDEEAGGTAGLEIDLSFMEDFQKMFMAIMLIILCIVLLPVLIPLITHVIIPLIKYFIKAIWFVITLPFRIIKSIMRK